jgi:putative oxidoreductase
MLKYGMDKLTGFNNIKGMDQLFGSPIDAVLVVFAEFFCSIFLILGLFTRFALLPLLITMCVAFFKVHHYLIFTAKCEDSGQVALLFLIGYGTLLLTGPGKFSIDRMIAK